MDIGSRFCSLHWAAVCKRKRPLATVISREQGPSIPACAGLSRLRQAQRPSQFGLRFSWKARGPSRASALL
jgi:hypothetical protein